MRRVRAFSKGVCKGCGQNAILCDDGHCWGCCPSFEAEDLSVYALGAHSEFLEKT